MIPKFRIWDITDKQWATDFTLSLDGNLLCDNGTTLFIRDNFILMQWTGCRDSDSKDIYDGDIIEIEDDGEIHKGTVRYSSSMFWVAPLTLFDDYALEHYTECPDFKIKVIGNIYENPELINTADNNSCEELK